MTDTVEIKRIQKPELCENCAVREPEELVAAGSKMGAAGIPVAVWLCSECVAAIPAPSKPKRRKTTRRTPIGRYGKDLMRIMYRVGGGTANQLGAFLSRERPEVFGSRKDPLASSIKVAQEELPSLRKAGLLKSLGVWREHAVGPRTTGRPEELYYLVGEGIAWGGSQNGVTDRAEAVESYKYHQLPLRPEHAAYRNDIYLRMLEDSEHANDVEMRVGDLWGESFSDYPYPVGRYAEPSEGSEMTAKRARRRRFEWLYPDGRVGITFDGVLVSGFDVEAERESGAREAARKMDRYAGYWARLYEAREKEGQAPRRRQIAKRLKEIETRLSSTKLGGMIRLGLADERTAHEEEIAALDVEFDAQGYLGLPEGMRPVLIVHRTFEESERAFRLLQEGNHKSPRLDDLNKYLAKEAGEQAVRNLRKKHLRENREEPSEETLQEVRKAAADQVDIRRLFAFTSFSYLRPQEKREKDLVSDEEYVTTTRFSFLNICRTLHAGVDEEVSLCSIAEQREAMNAEYLIQKEVSHGK